MSLIVDHFDLQVAVLLIGIKEIYKVKHVGIKVKLRQQSQRYLVRQWHSKKTTSLRPIGLEDRWTLSITIVRIELGSRSTENLTWGGRVDRVQLSLLLLRLYWRGVAVRHSRRLIKHLDSLLLLSLVVLHCASPPRLTWSIRTTATHRWNKSKHIRSRNLLTKSILANSRLCNW